MLHAKRGPLYVPDFDRQWIIPPSRERDLRRYRRYIERFKQEIEERTGLSFTFVNSGTGGAAGSLGTVATGSVASVHAGDLAVVLVKWEGADTAITLSDGGSTFVDAFSGAHVGSAGSYWTTFLYTLSTSSTASKTYTATFVSGNRTSRDIIAMVYTPTGTVTLDGTPKGTHGTSGTTATSGNITTTGSDGLAFGGYGDFTGVAATSTLINGGAKDRQVNGGAATASSMWAKAYAAGFTGQAAGTIAGTGPDWVCIVMAFQIAGGGATGGGPLIRGGELMKGALVRGGRLVPA